MKRIEEYTDRIICGDCLDVMKELPDNSVDLVLTDPPYGINYWSNRSDSHEKLKNDGYDSWVAMITPFLLEVKRILKPTGCCCCCCSGGGKTPVTAILTMELVKHLNLIQTLVWDKQVFGLGWRYRPQYENILIASNSKDKYNFYDKSKALSNIIRSPKIIPNKDEHPTQKPVRLMQMLLKIHSQKNDIVLDPFIGSGTTAVACKELDRKYIGIEISPEYCEIAQKRVDAVHLKLGLEA